MSILRPFQSAAVAACWEHITPDVNRVAVEMATGLGKTITFAGLIDEWLADHLDNYGPLARGRRALVLVHTDELVRQAVDKIRLVTRGRWTIGVVKAGEDEVDADIVVASVATLRQPHRMARITDVGLIIVDEAHHAVATSYVDILEHYGSMPDHQCPERPCWDCLNTGFTEPPVPTFGFTATLDRTDGRGLGLVWQDLAFSRSLPWAIRQEWLIDLVPYTITIPGITAGASDAALDAQLADSIAPEAVVQAWMEQTLRVSMENLNDGLGSLYRGRPSTVLFAPLVRSAQAFADAFNAAGVKAEVVSGAQPPAERKAVLDRYEAGITTVVCNAMVLTEGWDSPRTSCVIVARPTQSRPLFVQMVGRGLRPWLTAEAPPRDSQRCVLLAVAGTTTDLVTVADLSDNIGQVTDGTSFLAMEDAFLEDVPADEDNAYHGPVRVEAWDALVQRSSKAWKYTAGGVPFLPLRKRSELYVFIVEVADESQVWARRGARGRGLGAARVSRMAMAPDLELAMALAEDIAQDEGGDIGALLADKTRPWRKAVPSLEMTAQARRVGVPEKEIGRILTSKAAGKAGKLSDLIDTVTATRVLDHLVVKIRERGNKA